MPTFDFATFENCCSLSEEFFFQFSSKKAKSNRIAIIPNEAHQFYLFADIKFPNIYQISQFQKLIQIPHEKT